MKIKTTRKAIVNGSNKVRAASYCALQFLLRNHEPIAYTSGVYGWNFDVYEVYGLTICTGYRNMPGADLKECYSYNEYARQIIHDTSKSWDQKSNEVEKLLKEFCLKNGGAL